TTSDRLLSVLGLFTIERPEWTVEEAANELRLAASTTYRYFRSLSKAGLIVAFATGRYVLGPAIIQYDRQIRLRDPLTTAAQPIMKRLTQQLPAHTLILLCRLFRNQVMSVHQESAEKADFSVSYERGRAMPLFRGAASKIILAHMTPRIVKALYEEHAAKFAQAALGKNWNETRERLRTLRSAGVAIAQGEVDPGMCGIAVPVFEPAGTVIGSLSIVIPARHLTPNFLEEAPELLKSAAEQIHWALSLGAQSERTPAVPSPATATTKVKKATSRSKTASRTGASRKTSRQMRA
ncbi:MAG TPA: IclR family transcriptional regulator, partial [Steroidobacter sp.]